MNAMQGNQIFNHLYIRIALVKDYYFLGLFRDVRDK